MIPGFFFCKTIIKYLHPQVKMDFIGSRLPLLIKRQRNLFAYFHLVYKNLLWYYSQVTSG
jgi:hypothetical protein